MRKVRQAPRAAFPNVSQHDVSRCRLAAGTTARVSLAGPSEQKPGKARRSRCTLAILATKAKVSGLWRHTSSYPHLERPLRGEVRPLGLYWRGKPFPMIYRAVDIHFGGGECAQIPCFAMITGRCVCVCVFFCCIAVSVGDGKPDHFRRPTPWVRGASHHRTPRNRHGTSTAPKAREALQRNESLGPKVGLGVRQLFTGSSWSDPP